VGTGCADHQGGGGRRDYSSPGAHAVINRKLMELERFN
jgi:hypothetical protein